MKINQHYLALQDSYLFSTVAKKVAAFRTEHPEADLIRLGIGDVTLPLCDTVVDAMVAAAEEQRTAQGFRGYGPEQGYDFLRSAVEAYYATKQVALAPEEIFISDGAKSDLGNILDLFDADNRVLVPDPVYPVYVDTNVMAGRSVTFLNANAENGFLPMPDPGVSADLIYICSPNNPTGAVYDREQLKIWVDYALAQHAVILFDAAYEAFVVDPALPRSIYEVEGARGCAIEFNSFSKMAGFTGTRCGTTVVPRELVFDGASLNKMWLRRQTTKFNGVPYVVQRAAAAALSPAGQLQTRASIDYYRNNAAIMSAALDELEIGYTGGKSSPYIWMKCPGGMSSWAYFDHLLSTAGVVGTPGSGFGKNGEGYFRLTAFGDRDRTVEAMRRIKQTL
ncbi:MAG: LL-diaminopimelate aminotransferase [Oscillospiraceae bacterium]